MGKYAELMIETFEMKLEDGATTDGPIRFTSNDLRTAIGNIDHDFTRLSDAVYYYNNRSSLPDELQEHGYKHVISIGGEGQDGVYVFTKVPQHIDNTEEYDETILIEEEALPAPIREYVSGDEQGSLTQVRQANVIDQITGLTCYHLQSHFRTEIENQKMEADELYIGVNEDGEHTAIILEAKGTDEELNRSQLIRNTVGLRNSPEHPDPVITMGLNVDEEGIFYVSNFDVGDVDDETDLDDELDVLTIDIEVEKTWRCVFSGVVDDDEEEELHEQAELTEIAD